MSDVIQQSIVALEAEMSVLTQRLTDIDAALMALRKLAGTMPEAAPKDLPAAKPPASVSEYPSYDREERLLACLRAQDGLSSGQLAKLIDEPVDRTKYGLSKLQRRKLIHRSGTSPWNFRWHLGKGESTSRKRPAKEAVQ